jgi:hypothetical protein
VQNEEEVVDATHANPLTSPPQPTWTGTRESSCYLMLLLQQRFGINIWVRIIDSYPIGPHMVADFLELTFLILLKDVPLNVHESIWFQHNSASAKCCCQVHNWLNNHFLVMWIGCGGSDVWPLCSSDLNPLVLY